MSLGGGVTYWALRRDARDRSGTIPMLARDGARRRGGADSDARDARREHRDGVARRGRRAGADGARAASSSSRARRGSGACRSIEFFTGYRQTVLRTGELIAAIDVRVPKRRRDVTWRKVGTRLAQAIFEGRARGGDRGRRERGRDARALRDGVGGAGDGAARGGPAVRRGEGARVDRPRGARRGGGRRARGRSTT